jgi:hypothetical protein
MLKRPRELGSQKVVKGNNHCLNVDFNPAVPWRSWMIHLVLQMRHWTLDPLSKKQECWPHYSDLHWVQQQCMHLTCLLCMWQGAYHFRPSFPEHIFNNSRNSILFQTADSIASGDFNVTWYLSRLSRWWPTRPLFRRRILECRAEVSDDRVRRRIGVAREHEATHAAPRSTDEFIRNPPSPSSARS